MRITTTLLNMLVVAMLLSFSVRAMAWGALGHQVVCDIAWRASSEDTRKMLSRTAQRMGYKTFASSCVWADHIKSKASYDYLKPLHYINVKKTDRTVFGSSCVTSTSDRPHCVVTAISYYFAQWQQIDLSQKQRDQALLLLGHLVADIHQPLHVAYESDKGGTRKKVIFEGKLTSLHRLWDSTLVTCALPKQQRSWRVLGESLFAQRTLPYIGEVSSAVDIEQWANESLQITKTIYKSLNGKQRLPASYCKNHSYVTRKRLLVAGLRLAQLLRESGPLSNNS